ncbi:MAG TPA: DUF2798 domain-containing protein [Afifellaceae bacterium]|nr:DUF2798 domain-containing protein [Afifellaceae bacterium]
MKPFIPARLEFPTFGFLVSGMMSLLITGVAMLRTVGTEDGFILLWMQAWLPSWAVAFPAILVVVPIVLRMLPRLIAKG